MSVHASTFVHEADDIEVRPVAGDIVTIVAAEGRSRSNVHLTARAADSLYLKLGAALHGADEQARETAYQESQIRDAVERGLNAEPEPGWVYIDHERRITREQDQ